VIVLVRPVVVYSNAFGASKTPKKLDEMIIEDLDKLKLQYWSQTTMI